MSTPTEDYTDALTAALDEARTGVASGGMPFGAVLLVDGHIVSRGHNRQIQDGNFLGHAESVCLGSHLRGASSPLRNATLVATEAPCPMCAGTAVVAGVCTVVVGENVHYPGALEWLSAQGVKVIVVNDPGCIEVVTQFRERHADRWERFSAG